MDMYYYYQKVKQFTFTEDSFSGLSDCMASMHAHAGANAGATTVGCLSRQRFDTKLANETDY